MTLQQELHELPFQREMDHFQQHLSVYRPQINSSRLATQILKWLVAKIKLIFARSRDVADS